MPHPPANDLLDLKRQLLEVTRQFDPASNVEEKALLGADVRELERLVEIAAEKSKLSCPNESNARNRTLEKSRP
jgi:hypothetical protein